MKTSETVHQLGGDRTKRILSTAVVDLALLICCALILIPFLWTIATSLRPVKESFGLPPSIIPTQFVWDNYAQVFRKLPFLRFALNSLKIAAFATAFQLLVNGLAAYGFSRITFPGRDVVFLFILAGLMVPLQVTIIPLFISLVKVKLINTHVGVILPSIAYPLTLFLLRQFMKTIPKSYEEAAFIDGAGRLRIFFSIIAPMTKPAFGVAAILHFVHVWNDFFRPLILLSTTDKLTLPLGLMILNGYMSSGSLAVVLAGVVLSLIIPILIFAFFQRYLIEGMRIGGLKG